MTQVHVDVEPPKRTQRADGTWREVPVTWFHFALRQPPPRRLQEPAGSPDTFLVAWDHQGGKTVQVSVQAASFYAARQEAQRVTGLAREHLQFVPR